MLLFQRCALRKFYAREGHNARDQIAFYVFDSFLLEDQRNAGNICMPRMRYSNLEIRPAVIIIDILSKLVSLHFTNLLLWASVISWSNSSSFHITCSGLNKHEISTSSTSFTLPTAIQFGFAWEEKQLQVTTDERWNECANTKFTTLNKPLAARWLPSRHSGLKKREESWVRVGTV